MRTAVRTADGFPNWEIVAAGDDWFGYNTDTVTELRFDIAGDEWRLAVHDRSRLVIRVERETAAGKRVQWPNLAGVPGLVRVCRGPATYGHTDYYVARETTGVDY